LPEQGKTSTNS